MGGATFKEEALVSDEQQSTTLASKGEPDYRVQEETTAYRLTLLQLALDIQRQVGATSVDIWNGVGLEGRLVEICETVITGAKQMEKFILGEDK